MPVPQAVLVVEPPENLIVTFIVEGKRDLLVVGVGVAVTVTVGVGVAVTVTVGVGVTVGDDAEIRTPLFQYNFLPNLIQV